MSSAPRSVPVIDISALVAGTSRRLETADSIGAACRDHGFFYISGHGVSEDLQARLEEHSRAFFALDLETKLRIRMAFGGRAWRGYFPPGGELTSGQPDQKEGLYFGAELDASHPMVRAGVPMHGPNLFPPEVPALRGAVLEYIAALTRLGQQLMGGLSISLGLEEDYFARHYTADPLVLFRIFNYPAAGSPLNDESMWGVGEHTDYGVLTILRQDGAGGLQLKTASGWLDAPPIEGTFVCNIGDMLERLTSGLYRSTPHRVRNQARRDRLSFPFFFDPGFNTRVRPLRQTRPEPLQPGETSNRWDGASVHIFEGTYGDYLLSKVAKVFPALNRELT